MKVYFNASMAGKEEHFDEFIEIINIVRENGHEVYADHVVKRNSNMVNKQTRKQHELDFQKARNQIQKSNVMIVEASHPSIGVGHTMTIALEMHKPVLVLYKNDPHGLLVGDPNRLLTLRKYDIYNKKKLKRAIHDFLKKSTSRVLNKRFNLMIDKVEEEYLGFISRKEKISKADYVRKLLDEDLKKNEMFSFKAN